MNNLNYDLISFGKEIKKLRKRNKLTQKNIRDLIGLHPDTMNKLENGQSLPTIETVDKLSSLYKINIMKILESFRHDKSYEIDNLLSKMNYISYSNDLSTIDEIIKLANEKINADHSYKSDKIIIEQLHSLAVLIKIKNKRDKMNVIQSEEIALKALRLSHPTIDLHALDKYFFSIIELKLLMSLSFSKLRQKESEIGIKICEAIVDNARYHLKYNSDIAPLLVVSLFNLSYQHYIINNHHEVIRIAEEGIRISREQEHLRLLPQLLFRLGISQFHIGEGNYVDTLQNSILTLKVLGHNELAKQYIKVLKDTHDIELEFPLEL